MATPFASRAQVTVFNDTFASDTLNATGTPTATSTQWDIASTKNSTSSIAAGDLKFGMPATTSGFVEAQTLFTTSPITLSSTGDYIDLTATFTATAGILNSASCQLWVGLYSSGGSAPAIGLATSGLTTTAGSSFATGGTSLWKGYAARVINTGTSTVVSRQPQNGPATTSANQELLGNNVGGGAFDNPNSASNLGTSSAGLTLTAGSQYTLDLRLTYNSTTPSTTVAYNLYSGTTATGTALFTEMGTAAGTNLVTTGIDGAALGYRYNGTSAASSIDFSQLTVTDQLAANTPEPATLSIFGVGAVAGFLYRRRQVRS